MKDTKEARIRNKLNKYVMNVGNKHPKFVIELK